MINIKENISLKGYNTFGFDAKARYFCEVQNLEELKEAISSPLAQTLLILGGGSNVLLLEDFPGLVIRMNIKGIKVVEETEDTVVVHAGAGEIWHDLVLFTIENGWGGLENMSLIPGTVGAAPMQNIGAYGAEVKDTFIKLEALRKQDLQVVTFDNAQCKFGYRESFFKQEGKDQYVILGVSFKLKKNPSVNTSYGAIKDTLNEWGISAPTVKDVSNAVIHIRRSKLPDPAQIGNSGSFFKNPEIPIIQFEELQKTYPNLPSYPINPETVKVPAGWLIEQAGWKGKKTGHVGVHDKQALVLVHFGGGKGKEIANLASEIQASVYEKFGIKINPEVNFIPNFT
ncbi:UDP-N-acetylenolpyruvoylglucosamine reductase [Leadbetterella byssophila DSM 17132]|uniref:UDP-N-acetylenolpyruvoylglucosamine reductase n=1 Tax=Leadbetterella byssophila (strain DSM 17132 / JCM 16389 / KACC 11308 / NBRC 106382 / 4M15) TaxID=649349 RepID=E4RUN6_LEAB4|nr:UDP-N-acetylmuramate dehydrogenase [Leadbetterella byssophila]ADQ18772.1 UDP-N-acetylenolpyruvoylglucosamine reductase [Leadbetterella byssophila DSM 17132]